MGSVRNDLDQLLRSMILRNTNNDENRGVDDEPPLETNNLGSQDRSRPQQKRFEQHSVPLPNAHNARDPTRRGPMDPRHNTKSGRASNSRRGLPNDAQYSPNPQGQGSHGVATPQQRMLLPMPLADPHRARGGAPSRSRGSFQRARGGMRPPGSRLPNRFRQPTGEELQVQSLHLEKLAEEELPKVEMSPEEHAIKESFRAHLEALLRQAVCDYYQQDAPAISLVPFGSLASGFGMPGSDMDLALISPSIPDDMPRMLESTLLGYQLGARLLTRTRVPILKVCETPTQELYNALCAERQKWDEMTPSEKEEHDRGPPKKRDPTKQNETASPDSQAGKDASDLSAKGAESSGRTTAITSNGTQRTQPSSGEQQMSDAFEQVVSISSKTHEQKTNMATTSLPANHSSYTSTLSPEHLQYFQMVEIVRKDNPQDLDKWISLHPPPLDFDLNAALHSKTVTAARRKERPWYREKPLGPLDFPKETVGILCDINFSNPLGIHNTSLLHAYSACDVRVRLIVLFIKLWAGRRKINSGYNGTLSSYGYVLMVLHFLVNVTQPPVCPNLQLWETMRAEQSEGWPPTRVLIPANPDDPKQVCEGADVRFHRNEAELSNLARRQLLTRNREPLGVLLRNFFFYYATQGPSSPNGGFNWTQDVLSLRSEGGLLGKAEKDWTGARTTEEEGGKEIKHRFLFAIEDPFELDHNVARTVTHHGIVAIRDEFRRCARILDKVGRGEPHAEGPLLETLFVEAPVKDGEEGQSREVSNDTEEHEKPQSAQ